MIRGMQHLSRTLIAATLMMAGMIPAAPTARMPSTPSSTAVDAGQTTARIEVRLRKLHLVRPDLIQYPISYEVYC